MCASRSAERIADSSVVESIAHIILYRAVSRFFKFVYYICTRLVRIDPLQYDCVLYIYIYIRIYSQMSTLDTHNSHMRETLTHTHIYVYICTVKYITYMCIIYYMKSERTRFVLLCFSTERKCGEQAKS